MNIRFNILFIAAAMTMGCSKSEIHDSRYGSQEIGFETYVGREAQSKAPSYGSESLPSAVGVYGFYSGAGTWDETDSPNLWTNLQLTSGSGTWTYDQNQKRYWTNDKDNYTFLAYAPYATGTGETGNGLVASTGADPTVTYTVPADLPRQVDLLYSNNNLNTTKAKCTSGTGANAKTEVTLNMQHALSRLTVKASAKTDTYAYTFHIKEISVAGDFYTKGALALSDGGWANLETAATEENPDAETTYTFFSTTDAATLGDENNAGNALGATVVDYAIRNTTDGSVTDNYLMMIPVDFGQNAVNANLIVKYSTLYGDVESAPKTVSHPITTDFQQGKAYAININFELNNAIKFKIDEEAGVGWGDDNEIEIQ